MKTQIARTMPETKTRQSNKSQIDRPENLGKPQMKWGSDVVAEVTRRLDLKYIALVPGASYRGFHDSIVNYLGNSNPQMVICLHEEHAVSIADGYGKVTEEPMAVALHANVGLMHASMPIFNASHTDDHFRRHGPGGCASAPSLDRLDPHFKRPSLHRS